MELLEQQACIQLIDGKIRRRMRFKGSSNAVEHTLRENHAEIGCTLCIQQIQIFHKLLLLVLLGAIRALEQLFQFLPHCFQLLMSDFILQKHC